MYITTCEITSPSLIHETGHSKPVHWDNPEGWGTHVHPWLIYLNVWQKPLQYCKVISRQLKFQKREKLIWYINAYICNLETRY